MPDPTPFGAGPPPGGAMPPGLMGSMGGGMPPGLAALGQARPNIGPVPTPQGNPGNVHAAVMKIKNALQLLQEALPLIPLGSDIHTGVLKATQDLSRHMKDAEVAPASEMQSLLQSARQSAQTQPMQALSRLFPQGQGGGPALPPPPPGGGMPMAA